MNRIKVDEEIFAHVSKLISQNNTALYGLVTYKKHCLPQAGLLEIINFLHKNLAPPELNEYRLSYYRSEIYSTL